MPHGNCKTRAKSIKILDGDHLRSTMVGLLCNRCRRSCSTARESSTSSHAVNNYDCFIKMALDESTPSAHVARSSRLSPISGPRRDFSANSLRRNQHRRLLLTYEAGAEVDGSEGTALIKGYQMAQLA